MAITPGFAAMLEDLLSPLGGVSLRRMFSGAGVYRDGVMFGLVSNDVLFLKADETTQDVFEAEGCERFVARSKSRETAMPYWRIPDRLYDEPDELVDWARSAAKVALRKASASSAKGKDRGPGAERRERLVKVTRGKR